jgi:hypothetical protein
VAALSITFEKGRAMKKNRESCCVEDPNEDIIRMWAWVLGAINAGIYAAMPWGWLWGGVTAILVFLIVASIIEYVYSHRSMGL